MLIRIATNEDAKQIHDIYAPYVQNTNITFEYQVPSVEEMQSRIAKTLENYPYIVAVEDNQIIGYAYASRYRARQAYDWDSELSIYIDQNKHGQGVGQKLYHVLLALLKSMHVQNVYACITSPNLKSERFHQLFQFHLIGKFIKCGYKFEQWHDVIWMEKAINDFNHVEKIMPFSALTSQQIESCLNISCVQDSDNMV